MNDAATIKRAVFIDETCELRTQDLALACGPGFRMPAGHYDVFWLVHLAQANEGRYAKYCLNRAANVLRAEIAKGSEKISMLRELESETKKGKSK